MDFETVFELLIEKFKEQNLDFAVIGGFALHVAGYTRTTQDIDFIAPKEDMKKASKVMHSLGYDLADLGRVDFLHAHRKYARAMLARAKPNQVLSRHGRH